MAPDPVVTVTPTIQSGTVVRWYRSTGDNERPVLSASREGVMIHGDVFWHAIPREWLNDAKDAHAMLRLTNGKRDMSRFATRNRRGPAGPLEPAGGRLVTGLVTLQFGRPADGCAVHLVRWAERGTPGPTLCGIDRFAKDGPGWSVGGGVSGPGIIHTPCPGCAETARAEFSGLEITGLGAREMAEVLGVPWSHWNGGRFGRD
jgi:hypothetical protein